MKSKVMKKDKKREHKKKVLKPKKARTSKTPRAKAKIEKVMKEFGAGHLHANSDRGPIVTNPKQALAIGYSESRKSKKKK